MHRSGTQFTAAELALPARAASAKNGFLHLSLLVLGAIIATLVAGTAEPVEPTFPAVSMPDVEVQSVVPDKLDGHRVYLFDVTVKDPRLGYGRVRAWFDPTLQAVRQAAFYDIAGQPVSTIHIDEFHIEDGELRILRAEITNHRDGTKTTFDERELDPSFAARRGPPKFYF